MTLLERNPNAPQAWSGDMPVTSRYTFGLAGERFFRALREEGQILGSRCPKCDRTYVPATAFCERCLGALTEWIDVGLAGEVHTYTVLYQDLDGELQQPEIIVFVKFGDGGIIHKLRDVPIDAIRIGMQVEAVLKPVDSREGNILDIEYFRPVA
jgi:uncharacterized protein